MSEHLKFVDKELEECVLCCIMLEPDGIYKVADINPEDFYYTTNQLIYKALWYNVSNGIGNDLQTVSTAIEKLGSTVPSITLIHIIEKLPSSANIESHVSQLKEKSIARQYLLSL